MSGCGGRTGAGRSVVKHRSGSKRLWTCAVASFCLLTLAVDAEPAKKPAVPPGVDPGGVLVALIGEGVDYTDPAYVRRLARDGEGEIVGFDFVDLDRRPHAARTDANPQDSVRALVTQAPSARIGVFKTRPGDRVTMAKAMDAAAASPARIALVVGARDEQTRLRPPDFEFLDAASRRFPALLFVVAAGDQGLDLDDDKLKALPNVLVVTSTPELGGGATLANRGVQSIDVAASGVSPWRTTSEIAAARTAADAARLLTAEPALAGDALKRRLLEFAMPWTSGQPAVSRAGFLSVGPLPVEK
jgi:hypothetical protein